MRNGVLFCWRNFMTGKRKNLIFGILPKKAELLIGN